MSVTPSFQSFVVEQLGKVLTDVRARRMFGGVGIYAGSLFFALVDDDVLYFKVDASNRPDFEARGMGPFKPYGEGGETVQYYQVPEDVLEDPEELRAWAEKALGVAQRKRKAKPST